jgi:hypothetical protein
VTIITHDSVDDGYRAGNNQSWREFESYNFQVDFAGSSCVALLVLKKIRGLASERAAFMWLRCSKEDTIEFPSG